MLDVLKDKHPEMVIHDITAPGWPSFKSYNNVQVEMEVDCGQKIVQGVAGKLRRSRAHSCRWAHALEVDCELLNCLPGAAQVDGHLDGDLLQHDAALGDDEGTACCPHGPPGQEVQWGEASDNRGGLTADGADANAACGSGNMCAGLEADPTPRCRS